MSPANRSGACHRSFVGARRQRSAPLCAALLILLFAVTSGAAEGLDPQSTAVAGTQPVAPASSPASQQAGPVGSSEPAVPEGDGWGPIELLDDSVAPGQSRQLALVVSASLEGGEVSTPIFVHRGTGAGPSLCLTAGIHGDEVNGVEMVRRVASQVSARELNGTLISVPIVNVTAVRRGSRYLPDRRDLNRYFPGHPRGSAASRIANRFFESVIRHCSALVDIHTGSFHRNNLHQLRADLQIPSVLDLARRLGSEIVIHNSGRSGTLRGAAVEAGIPAVTIEGGEPARLSVTEVERGVDSILRLMASMNMTEHLPGRAGPLQEFYNRAHWIRAAAGGILVSRTEVGQRVVEGQELGDDHRPALLPREPDRLAVPGPHHRHGLRPARDARLRHLPHRGFRGPALGNPRPGPRPGARLRDGRGRNRAGRTSR